MPTAPVSRLRSLVSTSAANARVPYSHTPQAAVLLLSDGSWIPGVRVETASFSLSIPPLLNAVTTAVALGRSDVLAAVVSRPITPAERAYAAACPLLEHLAPHSADALVHPTERLVSPGERLPPTVETSDRIVKKVNGDAGDEKGHAGRAINPTAGIALAREIAARAYVPESAFPVGCVAETEDGLVPGVNVEHPDWAHILCAERNALGTCVSYALRDVSAVMLTCLHDTSCTPCGACRQLLAELAPTAALWMDEGSHPPRRSDPATLLPGSFGGRHLTPNT